MMKCQAILKSGERIGQECGAKAKVTVDDISYCGRHCVVEKEIKSECEGNQRRLCGKSDCEICFKRSFASHDRAKYWDQEMNIGIMPRDVFLNSNKKYWFTCDRCTHSFDASLVHIHNGRWCPYCARIKRKVRE